MDSAELGGEVLDIFCAEQFVALGKETGDGLSEIIPVVIVLRDIIVNAIKMEAASKGKVVAAIKSGKFKTATLMVGTSLTFFYNLPFELININVSAFLLYIAVILSVISAIQYWNLNKNVIFSNEFLSVTSKTTKQPCVPR